MITLSESIIGRKYNPNSSTYIMPRTCRDQDGNAYDAVRIGKQVWMTENLRTEHFRNGDIIPLDISLKEGEQGVPGRYYPEGKHFKQDGYLYNWYAVDDPRGLAPKGWHVPSQEEFEELESFLKSNSAFWYDGVSDAIGKSLASKDGWEDSDELWAIGTNPESNNYTKFNAYPIGPWLGASYRGGKYTYFWSATECSRRDRDAYYWRLDYNRYGFNNFPNIKAYGFSVRCIKD